MSEHEPVLHALHVEPRNARPGEAVRLVFRTANLGALASPAATARFVLPDALEPLGPVAVAIAPVPPGDDLVATLRARIAPALDDRTALVVRAALAVEGCLLGTNACTVVVRSRPVLDGAGSGVTVAALGDDAVRISAVVVNEGDGPARDVRVVVPVPAGCTALDADTATELALARLDVGERATVAYDARIVAPVAVLRAADAFVAYADGARCALPAREAVVLASVLAPPRVALAPGRRRVDIAIDVRNDGWADARDVRVRVTLPAPLRALDGSLVVDGVPIDAGGASGFARVERGGDETAITVAHVPARGDVRVALAASVPPACAPGAIVVGVGEHDVVVPFVAAQVRDVRLRAIDVPAVVEPGTRIAVVAEVANAGDLAETLAVSAAGAFVASCADVTTGTLAPGAVASVTLMLAVGAVADGAQLALAVVASDADGERARTEVGLLARDRAWLALAEPPSHACDRVAYVLRNVGTTTARDVVAHVGAETHALEPLAPGATATLVASERAAHDGGEVRVTGRVALVLPALDERRPAAVRATLAAPHAVVAGAAFAVRAVIEVDDMVETLALRLPTVDGAAYVAGSTTLDGRALLDRAHGSPLAGDGLVLRGVPAATRVTVAWTLLADAGLRDDTLALGAELVADGYPCDVVCANVAVRARAAFAARPAGVAYHVDACTLGAADAVVGAVVDAVVGAVRGDAVVAVGPIDALTSAVPIDALAAVGPIFALADAAHGAAAVVASDAVFSGAVSAALMTAAPPALAAAVSERPAFAGLFAPVASLGPADAVTFTLRLDAERLDAIARLVRAAEGGGLLAHVLALRAFFPEAEASGDLLVGNALHAARTALGDVFDRLFVKVRIPGFDAIAADLEDAALRRALVTLFEQLLIATPSALVRDSGRGEAAGVASVSLARDRAGDLLASFADAPFGAPAMLRALVALAPTRCDDPTLGAALARYAAALDAVLADCAAAPSALFDDALAHRTDRALDDARLDLLAAMRARRPLAGAA